MTQERRDAEEGSIAGEPNVLQSIWRHRLLVAVSVCFFGVMGLIAVSMNAPSYTAEAGALLIDPQPAVLSEVRAGRDKDDVRHIADQVAILKSPSIAERAVEFVAGMGARELTNNLAVRSSEDSNYVVVRVRAGSPEKAAAAANAVVRAYREFVRADLDSDVVLALERIDEAIDRALNELSNATVDGTAASSNETLDTAESQVRAIASELAQLRSGEPPLSTVRLQQLETELRAWLLIASQEAGLPGPVLRQSEQADGIDLLSALRSQRNRVEVESELAGDGVALFSPAESAKEQGLPLVAALAISLMLGGLVGAGIAYGLDARKRTFSTRREPAGVLGVPELAEIPNFSTEPQDSDLPVLEAAESRSAEAFRFLTFGIGLSRGSVNGRARGAANRSVAFVAALAENGTSTVVANTALAAAQEGYRVLAVDAGLRQGLSRLLLGRDVGPSGLSRDAAFGDQGEHQPDSFGDMRLVMTAAVGGTLSLLQRATTEADTMYSFRPEEIRAVLASVRGEFDVVLVDCPPILDVAHSGPIVQLADATVVVVPHRSEAAQLQLLADRLGLLDVHPIGYVYNFGSSRRDALWRRTLSSQRREPTKSESAEELLQSSEESESEGAYSPGARVRFWTEIRKP